MERPCHPFLKRILKYTESGESIILKDDIIITIENIRKSEIKISIEAPKEVVVCREEVVKLDNQI